jgi:hypothetical protein
LFRTLNLPIRKIGFSAKLAGKATWYTDTPASLTQLRKRIPSCTTGDLGIYANREEEIGEMVRWEGCAFIQLEGPYSFLGVAESVPIPLAELSRVHLEMIQSIAKPVYGIGYTHPLMFVPWSYADGMLSGPLGPKRLGHDRVDTLNAYQLSLRQWRLDQQKDQKGYRGWFRDVYPLQYLNREHVSAPLADGRILLTAGIGQLTACDDEHWWWAVTEDELPAARELLAASNRLLCAPIVPDKWHMPLGLYREAGW